MTQMLMNWSVSHRILNSLINTIQIENELNVRQLRGGFEEKNCDISKLTSIDRAAAATQRQRETERENQDLNLFSQSQLAGLWIRTRSLQVLGYLLRMLSLGPRTLSFLRRRTTCSSSWASLALSVSVLVSLVLAASAVKTAPVKHKTARGEVEEVVVSYEGGEGRNTTALLTLDRLFEHVEWLGLSQDCTAGLQVLQGSDEVKKAMQDISGLVIRWIGTLKSKCIANKPNCDTPLANNMHCCTYDGLAFWSDKDNSPYLDALQEAGSQMVPGTLERLSEVITLDWQNPIIWTTMNMPFIQPFYAPQACRNVDDSQEIAFAMSKACLNVNNIYNADTKICSLSF